MLRLIAQFLSISKLKNIIRETIWSFLTLNDPDVDRMENETAVLINDWDKSHNISTRRVFNLAEQNPATNFKQISLMFTEYQRYILNQGDIVIFTMQETRKKSC